MSRKTTLLVLLSFNVSMLMLGGCGQKNSGSATTGQERSKDELILAIGGEPDDGFDPTTGWGRYGSPLFQSTLLTRDNDLKIVNDLAADYNISDDGLVWTVNLRDDVKFSDGQPLTAADVVYTYQTAASSGSVVDLSMMKSVEATGDYGVKFTLKHPQSTFVVKLTNLGIIPKHAYGPGYAEKPLGSGPFQFVQWNKGQQLIVEANPHYYGEQPTIKKVTFLFLDEDAAFAAAKAGQVDLVAIPPTLAGQKLPGMKLLELETVDNRGILFPTRPSGTKIGDGSTIGNDVTADLAIRRAINVGIDRKALVDGVLEGYGTPAYSAADKLPWWNPDTVVQDAYPDQAREILAAAGWKDTDGDGILEKDTLKAEFNMYYPASDQTRQSLAIAVADMMLPLGIKANVEGKSWDDIYAVMHSNPVLFGWGSHDPLEIYNLYYSKMAGQESYNAGYYENSAVDRYMDAALAAVNENEALAYWKKAQWDGETGFAAQGDAPWAWLVNLKHIYLVREDLDVGTQRIQPHGHGWPITDNIVQWRLK